MAAKHPEELMCLEKCACKPYYFPVAIGVLGYRKGLNQRTNALPPCYHLQELGNVATQVPKVLHGL